MTRLLLIMGLLLFSMGCSSTSGPPTEEEIRQNKEKMDADLQEMTGKLPEKPS